MKRSFAAICIVFNSIFLFGQNIQEPLFKYFGSSFDILYGTRIFKNNFYEQLNTLEGFEFLAPLQTIGFGYSGAIPIDGRNRSHYKYGHWTYTQIIPQKIQINDTIKSNINGYLLSIDVTGYDFFKRAYVFHLIGSLGFNTGRLRLHGNEWARQKNPFFSPRISIQPKIRIGRLLVSVRADYEWDISSENWRKTYFAKKNKISLNPFKETGATVLFCVGLME